MVVAVGSLFAPSRKAPKAFEKALQKASKLAAKGDAEGAIELQARATATFVEEADRAQIIENVERVRDSIVAVVAAQPSTGIALFEAVRPRDSQLTTPAFMATVLRARVEAAPIEPLTSELDALDRVLRLFFEGIDASPGKVLPIFAQALREIPASVLAPGFSNAVATRVLAQLDAQLRRAWESGRKLSQAPKRSALEIMEQLEISGRTLERGDVYCALGDMALERDERDEALARYRLAVEAGSAEARERLGYHLARQGHQLLREGEPNAALALFGDALEVHDDPWYRVFAVIARCIEGSARGDAASLAGELERAGAQGVDGGVIALWTAVAYALDDRLDLSATELRTFAAAHGGEPPPDRTSHEALTLLASLEGDDARLVALARELVTSLPGRWLSDGPIDPWPMAAAVARREPDLLAEMVRAVDAQRELPEWLRLAGAHALVRSALQNAASGAPVEAEASLALAERCLQEV